MAAEPREAPCLGPTSLSGRTQHWVKEEPDEETRHCWSPLELVKVEQGSDLPLECLQTEWDAVTSPIGGPAAAGQWSTRQQRMLVLSSPQRETQRVPPDPGSAAPQAPESIGLCGSTEPVKEEVLSTEGQRQRFRRFLYQEAEEPKDVYQELSRRCWQWLQPERSTKEQMLELVVLEQFVAILPPELQGWVRGGEPETCRQAVALAEDFLRRQEQAKERQGKQMLFSEVSTNLAEGPSDLLGTEPKPSYKKPKQENTRDLGTVAPGRIWSSLKLDLSSAGFTPHTKFDPVLFSFWTALADSRTVFSTPLHNFFPIFHWVRRKTNLNSRPESDDEINSHRKLCTTQNSFPPHCPLSA